MSTDERERRRLFRLWWVGELTYEEFWSAMGWDEDEDEDD